MSVRKSDKWYMAALLLLPVLAQYHIGGVLDYDVLVMCVFLIGTVISRPNTAFPVNAMTVSLIFYIFIVTAVNVVSGQLFATESEILLRSGRFLLYLFMVLMLKAGSFDYAEAMKIYRVIAFCALFYILLQTAVYYTVGVALPSTIGGSTASNFSVEEVARPHSFYSEPADMALSLIPFVCCSLFGPMYREKDSRLLDALLASVAVFMSTSGQGTLFLIMLWIVWLVVGRKSGYGEGTVFFAVILGAVALYALIASGLMSFILERITGNSTVVDARSGGYTALELLSFGQRMFGTGFGNYFYENIYGLDTYGLFVNFSSFAESLFTLGIVGTAIVYIPLLKRFFTGCAYQRALIFAFIFLSIASCPLSGKFFPIYFSFIFCTPPQEKPLKESDTANEILPERTQAEYGN